MTSRRGSRQGLGSDQERWKWGTLHLAVAFLAIAPVAFAASAPGSQGPNPMFDRQGLGVLGIPFTTLTLAVNEQSPGGARRPHKPA